ncbi:hypothetical protein EDB92DRAFT_1812297 [Lactarius akahatsu]|uniref:Uncharacterized protein n=1 Tax=Lactarius akahatsu TaxID=416441 RepID=A0AAD4QI59_9AGAM|nr:hypothetical protein EDB92DRAFT_1812297 [Lactarius akahatsu]
MSSASTFDKPGIDYNELAGSDDIGTYPIDPSPSSLLPLGVSIETVTRLTHDELLHNAEFAKQVHLVATLQELLKFCSKTMPNEKVLWTLTDCKVDTKVNSSTGNKSQPPMLCAIHHEDGTIPLNVTPYYKYLTEQVEKSNAKGAKKSGKKKPGESTTQQAKAPQPSASRAPPAKKARTKGKHRHDPSPPPQSEKRRKYDDNAVLGTSFILSDLSQLNIWPASPQPAFLSIVKSGAVPLEPDRQTSRITCAKSAMQAGDRVTDREEAGIDNMAAQQWESSPLPPSCPTTPKHQDNGNGDDEGDKHGDRKSGSGNGDDGDEDDGDSNSNGLLTTLKHDNLIAWIAAHHIKLQGKQVTKKGIYFSSLQS